MTVKGPWMQRLSDYVKHGDPDAILAMTRSWELSGQRFHSAAHALTSYASTAEDGFSSTSRSGVAVRRQMETSGKETDKKSKQVKEAVDALHVVNHRLKTAMTTHATLEATLPGSHDPVDASKFKTEKGLGVSEDDARKGRDDLKAAQAKFAAQEAAIAHAEKVAQEHVTHVDNSVDEAEPKVRVLYDDGSDSSNATGSSAGGGAGAMPPGTSSYVPGSRSKIAEARARMAKYDRGGLYPGGVSGTDMINQAKADIAAATAENLPEWDASTGMWVQHDGSPASADMYASVETADGLSPLSGAAAAGIGLGAVGLGAGALALAKNGAFGARIASSLAGAKAATAPATAGKVNAGAPGQRTGATKTGSAAGKAGAGSGQRRPSTGKGGSGHGPGGRGKKDKKGTKGDNKWVANTDEDWLDPNYKGVPKSWSQDPSRHHDD